MIFTLLPKQSILNCRYGMAIEFFEDILIACMDGLTGFPDAVKAVFPDTHIQHCIVHMIRNSTKFVSYKDLKAVCRDLKEVYSTINAESGHEALEEFGKKWNDKYPMIQASCKSSALVKNTSLLCFNKKKCIFFSFLNKFRSQINYIFIYKFFNSHHFILNRRHSWLIIQTTTFFPLIKSTSLQFSPTKATNLPATFLSSQISALQFTMPKSFHLILILKKMI